MSVLLRADWAAIIDRVIASSHPPHGSSGACYVYALIDEAGVPFYVGKGTGRRWLSHETRARNGRSTQSLLKDWMMAELLKSIGYVPKVKLAQGLSDCAASLTECLLIAELGRMPQGPLANLTQGGEGAVGLSAESHRRMVQAQIAAFNRPEIAAARSATSARMHADPEFKKRHRAAVVAAHSRSETKARHAAALKAYANQPANIAARSESSLAMHADPEFKAKHIESMRAASCSPEARARLSAAANARWAKHRASRSAP